MPSATARARPRRPRWPAMRANARVTSPATPTLRSSSAKPPTATPSDQSACPLRGGCSPACTTGAAPAFAATTIRARSPPSRGRASHRPGSPESGASGGRKSVMRLLVGELSVDPAHVRAELLAGGLDGRGGRLGAQALEVLLAGTVLGDP